MKIGDAFYAYDPNIRHYYDDKGVKHNGPIYIKSFKPWYVVGETKQSWLLSTYPLKAVRLLIKTVG